MEEAWRSSLEELTDLLHLLVSQGPVVGRRGDLLDLLDRLEPGDRDSSVAPGPDPAERRLGQRPTVLGEDGTNPGELFQLLGLKAIGQVPDPAPDVVGGKPRGAIVLAGEEALAKGTIRDGAKVQ